MYPFSTSYLHTLVKRQGVKLNIHNPAAGLLILIAALGFIAQFAHKLSINGKNTFVMLREIAAFLVFGVLIAQLWAHVDYESYHHFMETELFNIPGVHHTVSVHFLVNDIFMTFFFGIAAAELSEAIFLKKGDLNGAKAILPVGATLGGVLVPAGMFLLFASLDMVNGAIVPTATDIAFAWLGARLVFGGDHPATKFLLALAVVDDFIGMLLIAWRLPQGEMHMSGFALLAGAMATAYLFRRLSTRVDFFNHWEPYIAIPGIMAWFGLAQAGLHSALALVFVVPFMPLPHEEGDDGLFADNVHHHDSTVDRFKHSHESLIDVGLGLFGLANAGVVWWGVSNVWSEYSTLTLLSLGIGKLVGVSMFTAVTFVIARLFIPSLTLPINKKTGQRMYWSDLPTIGTLAGIGMTVALFVISAGGFKDDMKLGALASLMYLPIGVIMGRTIIKWRNKKGNVEVTSQVMEDISEDKPVDEETQAVAVGK